MKTLLLVIILFTTLAGYSQQEITGIIHNEKEIPLVAVEVTETGTTNTVYTDKSGIFKIKVKSSSADLVVQAKDFPTLRAYQIMDKQLEITMTAGKGPFLTIIKRVSLDNTAPPSYKTQIEFKPKQATELRLQVIPPVYETVSEQYELEPASARLIAVPAVYETVTEQVLVSDGGSRLVAVPDGNGGMTTKSEQTPAEYKTITKRVMKTPATTRSVDIPSKYGTRTVRRIVSPATTTTIEVPVGSATPKVIAHNAPVSPKNSLTKSTITPTPAPPEVKSPEAKPMPKISRDRILTATEINDFSKWGFWSDITETLLKQYNSIWKMNTKQRYCIQVKKKNGSPLVGSTVHLLDKDEEILWTARTDNTGKAELWGSFFQAQLAGEKIQVVHEGRSFYKRKIKTFQSGINVIQLPIACKQVEKAIDIAFVVDATGSMRDELQYIKDELRAIVKQTTDELPYYSLQLATVFYADVHLGDEFMYAKDFTADLNDMNQFISDRTILGGGDYPEAVDHGLEKAMSLNWRDGATTKLLFLILDAPPHRKSENFVRLQAAIQTAAAKGIRIIPVGCSGTDKSTEYLMRTIALATNGSYVHLTDDSGVGKAHSTPTAAKIDKELLNQILIRQITQFSKIEDCQPDLEDLVATLESEPESPFLKKDEQHSIDWSFFPNPTTGSLQIKASKPIRWIHVLDINGKLLKRVLPTTENATSLNIREFPSAVYLLHVFFENGGQETGKVVLTR